MAYTKAQAKNFASQIHSRFGQKIASATKGTPVPAEFVAGLIGVEAGKDKKGNIVETATRFERGVYAKLVAIRDGKRKSWSHIRQADIKDASNAALKNLDCTITELRDPEKHLTYAVKLLMLNSADGDFQRKEYVGEFREWNTGSEKGTTYHADYVANAGAVMDAYRELLETGQFVTEGVTEEPEPVSSDLVKDLEKPAKAEPQAPAPAQNIPAIPPLPVNVPGWVKQIVGWGSGLSFGGLGASFAALRDDPAALMAALNILKWGFIALGVVAGVVAAGLIVMRMQNAKLANDLNIARLRNFADPDTTNIDFRGWKDGPRKTEVKL